MHLKEKSFEINIVHTSLKGFFSKKNFLSTLLDQDPEIKVHTIMKIVRISQKYGFFFKKSIIKANKIEKLKIIIHLKAIF